MNTYTIDIPGAFMKDWWSAYEDLSYDARRDPSNLPLVEMIAAIDGATERKHGKGTITTAVMSREALQLFRLEAVYRWEMNGGNGDPYGGCEAEGTAAYKGPRGTALTLLRRIDALLEATA